jgi:hypothetical protein
MLNEKEYLALLNKYVVSHKDYFGYGHSSMPLYLLEVFNLNLT